jgi:RND family efflux transporter MFP subunit
MGIFHRKLNCNIIIHSYYSKEFFMKTKTLRFGALALSAAAGIYSISAANVDEGGKASGGDRKAAEIQVVKTDSRPITEEVVGSLRTRVRSVIEAKVSGRITEFPVMLGQKVKSGELLAEIDAREIQARLEQALAQREQAEKDLDRARTLASRQVSSKQELDAAEARYKVADAAMREASAIMANARIAAPFDGVVSRKLAEVGDLAAPGKPLLEIEDRGSLRFEADVPEALIGFVNRGDKVRVTIPAIGETVEALVAEMSPTADAASRTFLVKLDLTDAPRLRAGQFGRAAIPVGEAVSIRIPAEALVKRGQMEMVFVEEGGVARLRLVKTGKTFDDGIEILAGLASGDRLIQNNPSQWKDGQSVEVKK